MGKLFGTDGIRGQANTFPVNAELALKLGKALGTRLHASGYGSARAVIGKDTRLSGYMLETAITSGLVSAGCDVFLVGPVPTPAVAHLTRSLAADVGIMLTASHNPYDDNGIKIFNPFGYKLEDEEEESLTRLILDGDLSTDNIRSDQLGKAHRLDDARGRYIEFAKSTIDNAKLSEFKVVMDCANGSAYNIGPWIFRELGATVIKTGVTPDGLNINAGCGALYPECIAKLVQEHKADIGIALDGDADRVIFADANGAIVDGDRILAACAIAFKKQGLLANDTLVVTGMSNLGLHEAMRKHGIRVEVTDVGDRYVIDAMRKGGHSLGGEKSGHLIFHNHATTGDGIIGALQVMRMMKQEGKSLAELTDCMTEYPQRLVSLPIKEKRPIHEVPALTAVIQACERELQQAGRVIVRYSGTESKIRLLVEASESALVERWVERLTQAVEESMGDAI
ncbi:MAG TPA: phosphoglucosamine mutase [Kiritimatiellia bacterium]|jgi:phosphoglucosamine mutase|nr:phosphoglucosamine mutase [Kiritimatiellia bacterium]HPK36922.1 phosphoglucosamine mutase [Kiritimatiellia bacterium]HPW75419.1 phosphoglucosamine mutase [Kiritimatiellia bacterium]HRU20049.1 phosphoglucosamine mutase [Kiritimatiellia bacterium]